MFYNIGPVLGPAMLWAAWKGGEDSAEVLKTLISLGGKPNQVNTQRSYSQPFIFFVTFEQTK
jgi:hypothetical protein